CFVCESADATAVLEAGDGHRCSICNAVLDIEKPPSVLKHIGAHILHDEKINRGDEPCGLCARPSPRCHFMLQKGSGTDALKVNVSASRGCPHFKKFSVASAGKSTKNSPCTNTLVRCPECTKDDPAV
ncbi:hypothetical protein C8F01DRAFT_994502, partial [Mycena amicta]